MSCCLNVWLAHSRLLFALESPSGFSFSVFYVEGKTYIHTYTHTHEHRVGEHLLRRGAPLPQQDLSGLLVIFVLSCFVTKTGPSTHLNLSDLFLFSPCCCWSLRVLASSFSCCYAFSHLKSSFFGFFTLHSSLPAL